MYQQQYWSPTNQNQWQQTNYIPQTPNVYKPTIPGRIVNSIGEVTPNEVPMDGSVGIFMLKDMSELYSKAWASDGTIKTVKYIPEPLVQAEPVRNPLDEILERLDKIEALVSTKPNSNSRQKEVK